MVRVVVVGMGFAGLAAVKVFGGRAVDVLAIDRHNFHLFQPLLYQVASAGLEQESIAYPVRSIIRHWDNVQFLQDPVRSVDLDARRVITPGGAYPYDYLILATGSVTSTFGIESVRRNALVLKRLDDAVLLRNHVFSVLERAARAEDPATRQALLTFVVVGAGATGVELCGALADLFSHALESDYPELRGEKPRIVLLEMLDRVLPMLPPRLQEYAQHRLVRMGVEVRLNTAVAEVAPDHVLLKGGGQVPTYTTVWTAGVQGAPLAETLDTPRTRGHRIEVAPDLSLPAHPEVYVVGDAAHVVQDGQPLAMVAPVAMQEGAYAARAILERERGRQPAPFHYVDKGSMAIIGRFSAVAYTFGRSLTGFIAWSAWLLLHLYYLVGFRNRLIALLNWVYSFLLRDPRVRVIAPEEQEEIEDLERPAEPAEPQHLSEPRETHEPDQAAVR
ncbi:MAG: NAD(P)/FAD-dependent oxidoreductase [Anaerolineae bacterium]